MDTNGYQRHYTDQRFWQKAGTRARRLGRGALEKALYLYYAARHPDTPAWARRVSYGALGYFILPLDAIPDLAPIIGYTDDLSVMAAALATIAWHVTPDVKAQARERLDAWFSAPPAGHPQDA